MKKYKILAGIFLFLTAFIFLAMLMDDCYSYTSYKMQSVAYPYIYYIFCNVIDYGIFFVPFGILGFYFLKKSRENVK